MLLSAATLHFTTCFAHILNLLIWLLSSLLFPVFSFSSLQLYAAIGSKIKCVIVVAGVLDVSEILDKLLILILVLSFRAKVKKIFNLDDTMMNMESSEKKWEMDRDFSEKQECSVCLCDQTNFVLPCGHTFHKACILECFRRKYECILCRRT